MATCASEHKSQVLARDCAAAGIWAKHGVIVGSCLGCGVEGCVYASDAGKVVKLTRSRSETDLAVWLATRGPVDYINYLPRIYRVSRIVHECVPRSPSRDDANRLAEIAEFVIVREDIPGDVQVDIPHIFDEALLLYQGASSRIFDKYGVDPDASRQRVSAWQGARREVRGSIAELFGPELLEFYGAELLRVADIIEWGMKNGIQFEDWRRINLGVRANGQIVLRDLGFASAAGKADSLPSLAGLSSIHRRRKKGRR